MKELTVIFPHQLFEDNPAIKKGRDVVLVEDPLFFGDHKYPLKFHKMKLTFHRASLKYYSSIIKDKEHRVQYIDYSDMIKNKSYLFDWIFKKGYEKIHVCKPDDDLLSKRLSRGSSKYDIKLEEYENPSFMNDEDYLVSYFRDKKSYFLHHFYVDQRKKFDILIEDGKPVDGKWSFDSDNRKPIGKNIPLPEKFPSRSSEYLDEAKKYVNKHFKNNPGENNDFYLPITFSESKSWLNDFFEIKFSKYGTYQDAIDSDEVFLFHSVLSPLLNVGILTPDFIINKALEYSENYSIPINSLEGFIRQILGWREFIRGVYLIEGVKQRNSNFWNHERKIPKSFYDGSTGILPVDNTIRKLRKTGYNHHIERLMILGNFMLLCEFHPTEVYNWFMEMYIDSYDWVMVPNVYGMSQFADGGLMSTKPYISSSNYVKKMSNYKSGDWDKIWDALFWNFVHKHQKYFSKNNRTVFISRNLEKMSEDKITNHLRTADSFLKNLN